MVTGVAPATVLRLRLAEEVCSLFRKGELWGGCFGGDEGHLHRVRRGKGDSGGYDRGGRQRNGPIISRPLIEETVVRF